jgi:hypothetical protein
MKICDIIRFHKINTKRSKKVTETTHKYKYNMKMPLILLIIMQKGVAKATPF